MKGYLASRMFMRKFFAALILAFFLGSPAASWACTTIVVGKDASATGNILFGRTEDIDPLNGVRFVVYPAGTFEKGEVFEDLDGYGFEHVFTHDSYKYTGTPDMLDNGDGRYDAHGVNEHGLAVTATNTTRMTAGARSADEEIEAGIREAVLTTILLGECKTAREAVRFAGNIVETKGSAETYVVIIADKSEAWLFETFSGHHWAASRVPDDKFAIIANDMVTTYVDLDDTENFMGSEGFEALAEQWGISVSDDDGFNIAKSFGDINSEYDTYRRWRGYNLFAPSQNIQLIEEYDASETYTLFVKPDKKITVAEIMSLQRDRYNGTEFDLTESPLVYDEYGETDPDPRPIGVASQIETHIYEMGKDYAPSIGARFWMAMAQSEHSVYLPFYGLITDTHPYFQKETDYGTPEAESAYWVFQELAYNARSNRKMYGKPIQAFWKSYEEKLIAEQIAVEAEMLRLYAQNPTEAADYITKYTIETAGRAMAKAGQINVALTEHIRANSGDKFTVPEETLELWDVTQAEADVLQEMLFYDEDVLLVPAVKSGEVTLGSVSVANAPEIDGYKYLPTRGGTIIAELKSGNIGKIKYELEITGELFAAFDNKLENILKDLAIIKEFSERNYEETMLIGPDGLLSLEDAIEDGIASLTPKGNGYLLQLEFYLFDGYQALVYDERMLLVSDGVSDGFLKDPIWAARKIHSDSGSSSGCSTGAGIFGLLFALAMAYPVLKKRGR